MRRKGDISNITKEPLGASGYILKETLPSILLGRISGCHASASCGGAINVMFQAAKLADFRGERVGEDVVKLRFVPPYNKWQAQIMACTASAVGEAWQRVSVAWVVESHTDIRRSVS